MRVMGCEGCSNETQGRERDACGGGGLVGHVV